MTDLVIGLGEVGTAIREVLKRSYRVIGLDIDGRRMIDGESEETDTKLSSNAITVMHVCYPWSDTFITATKEYQRRYNPGYVVVHSTVPPGTCDANEWIHSPVHGQHPNLASDMENFTKFFGGKNAYIVALRLTWCGISTLAVDKAVTTELGKLWELVQYGMAISMEKMIHRDCKEYDADFTVAYTEMARSYNRGYAERGKEHFQRPIIEQHDGPIGGHCVVQNSVHLSDYSFNQYAWMLSHIITWAGTRRENKENNDTSIE